MQKPRIKRDYRQGTSVTRFLAFCQTVRMSLSANPNYPDEAWGSHIALRDNYIQIVDRLTAATHLASDGGRQLIRDRDKVREETIVLLDQIASYLEIISVNDPSALFTTGFTVVQERRKKARTKPQASSAADSNATDLGDRGMVNTGASQGTSGGNTIT